MNQLKQAAAQNVAPYVPVDVGSPCPEAEAPPEAWHLSEGDRKVLTGFVNPFYLKDGMIVR